MKKIILLGMMVLFFGCNSNSVEKPNNLIGKDKMVDILYDISLLEAIKTQNINGGITVKTGNDFIYKKHKIDSVQFAKSNKYYASDVEAYKKLFEKVKERLNKENILAKCGWSPFDGYNFKSRITHTFVNGQLVYHNFKVKDIRLGKRLLFDR